MDGKLAEPDSEAWHGGSDADEVAALISLILGVRLRNAGTFRLSGIHENIGDLPPMYREVPRLSRPGPPGREVLPGALIRPTHLSGLSRLNTFPDLDKSSQIALVRAARSYASALWWANEDTNQSWLQMVTAVEIAAQVRQKRTKEYMALLEEFLPDTWRALDAVGTEVKQKVARTLARLSGATRSFVDFVYECAPLPPKDRPALDTLDWDDMRSHAKTIYKHRSEALHAGRPFPMPMLTEPAVDASGAIQEITGSRSIGGPGGIWAAPEYPMLLSTFEYIARGALLRWWDEITESTSRERR